MRYLPNTDLTPMRLSSPKHLQVVSDVAVASSQSLPPYLAALYARVIVLQMQGVLVPPACTGAYAFEGQVCSTMRGTAWVHGGVRV